jgi:hypothetical protein
MTRPRHSDSELLSLASEGSASAFAALLHRHRHVLRTHAAGAAEPELAVERAAIAAMRRVRRRSPIDAVDTWLATLVDEQVAAAPATSDVERIFPTGWFDQLWVRVQRRWPRGRSPLHLPKWLRVSLAAVMLVVASAGATYVVLTNEDASDVVLDLSSVPLEGPGILASSEPAAPAEPEEAPELFGDVEIGELPTYDLTGRSPTG